MNFKIKKFIYFLNDLTNILLKKDREGFIEKNKKLNNSEILIRSSSHSQFLSTQKTLFFGGVIGSPEKLT